MGRTGPLFAIEDEGVVPDVLLVGKSLASGIVPIGALLARRRLWPRVELSFSMSASSFSGNRLTCVAALATLDLAEQQDMVRQGRNAALALRAELEGLRSRHPTLLQRISGRGLLLGLHFASPALAGEVIRSCIQNGLLIAAAFCNNRCVLLEPPLIISRNQITRAMEILDGACAEAAAQVGPASPSSVTT
jgi:putrescine aminotransferase